MPDPTPTPTSNAILLDLAHDVKQLMTDVAVSNEKVSAMKEDMSELKEWRAGMFVKGIGLVTVCLIVGQLAASVVLALIKP